MTQHQFSPDVVQQRDELVYLFDSIMTSGDAIDAVDTVDAMLSAYRDQVLTEAAEIVRTDVRLQGPYLDVLLARISDILLAARTNQES